MSLRLIGGMFSGGNDKMREEKLKTLLSNIFLYGDTLARFYKKKESKSSDKIKLLFLYYLNDVYFIIYGKHTNNEFINQLNLNLNKMNIIFNKNFDDFRNTSNDPEQLNNKIIEWEKTFFEIKKIIEYLKNIKNNDDIVINENDTVKINKNLLMSVEEIDRLYSQDKIEDIEYIEDIENIANIGGIQSTGKMRDNNGFNQKKGKNLFEENKDRETIINDLRNKILKLEQNLNEERNKYSQYNTVQTQNGKLQGEIEELQTKLSNNSQINNKLTQEKEKINKELAEQKATNKKLDIEIKELTNQYDTSQKENSNLQNEIAELKEKLSKNNKINVELRQEKDKYNEEKKKCDEEINTLQEQIKNLKNKQKITRTDLSNTATTVFKIEPKTFLEYMKALANEIDDKNNDEQLKKEFKILYIIASCLAIKNESFKNSADELRIKADECKKIDINNIDNYFEKKDIKK
jgi:chromosome segregation ATPase